MKSSDIKIGEKYLVEYGLCGKVLETRLERRNWSGTTRREGVKVLIQGGYQDGKEKIIPSREVHQLWSKHEERQQAKKLRLKVDAQDRARSEKIINRLSEELARRGIKTRSVNVGYGYQDRQRSHFGNLGLDNQEMEKLIDLLSSKEMGSKAAKADPQTDPLTELLSQ